MKYTQHPDPTPDQILASCREIQKTWDPAEEAKRRGVRYTDDAMEVRRANARGMVDSAKETMRWFSLNEGT